jgi:hypothetical protein
LDPPSIIFIARLHLTSVARRKFAAAAGRGLANGDGGSSSRQKQPSRIPPPVELPVWAQQQQAEHLSAVGHSRSSEAVARRSGHASSSSSHGREQLQRRSYDSSGSSSSAAGGSRAEAGSCSTAAAAACSEERRLEDAPELLCCPITGQVGVCIAGLYSLVLCLALLVRYGHTGAVPAGWGCRVFGSQLALIFVCILLIGKLGALPIELQTLNLERDSYSSFILLFQYTCACNPAAACRYALTLTLLACVFAWCGCCLQVMLQPVTLPSGKTFEVGSGAQAVVWQCCIMHSLHAPVCMDAPCRFSFSMTIKLPA